MGPGGRRGAGGAGGAGGMKGQELFGTVRANPGETPSSGSYLEGVEKSFLRIIFHGAHCFRDQGPAHLEVATPRPSIRKAKQRISGSLQILNCPFQRTLLGALK